MPLFDEFVTDVVTPTDIRQLTGVSAYDFDFPNSETPEEAMDELLSIWIERIASHIHTRLERQISSDQDEYQAVQDILIRTVAKVVAVAQQQRTSPVVQISDFAVSILNTSEVTKDLGKELRPFQRGGLKVFSSLDEYKG